jgi:Domain of Unknown Function (DUF928)
MRLVNRAKLFQLYLACCLGIFICGLPIAAFAIEFQAPRRGLPGRREGAGTRGPACVQDARPLTALLPQTNLGLTTDEYPQFFWYIPKTRAKTLKFSLFQGTEQDPTQALVYETTLTIPGTSGIMSFTLPKGEPVPPLALNKLYSWSIALNCATDDAISNPHIEGWVQRVALPTSLKNQLAKAKPSDRPQLFAQNQLWFDTVSSLATLRCQNPANPDTTASWKQLLKSVKLDKIADQSLQIKCQTQSKIRPTEIKPIEIRPTGDLRQT